MSNTIDYKKRSDVSGRLRQTSAQIAEVLANPMMRSNAVTPDMRYGFYPTSAHDLHFALELGMKSMYGAECKIHDLGTIYDKRCFSERRLLAGAFDDAVAFFGFRVDRDEWAHMRGVKTYLAQTGSVDRFNQLRYAPREGFSYDGHLPDLRINYEMVRFISDALVNYGSGLGGPFFLSRLVDRVVRNAYRDELGVFNASNEEQAKTVRLWIDGHKSVLSAIKKAYECDFHVLNDSCDEFLRRLYGALKDEPIDDWRIRPALDYVFSTFGAKASYCEEVASARICQSELVYTPAGSLLGAIKERHDGLWLANEHLALRRSDAVGLVIEDRSERVFWFDKRVRRDARVHFPDGAYGIDGEVVCEFWDANHGIGVSDKVVLVVETMRDNRGNEYPISGNVKCVEDHNVVIVLDTAL